MKDFEARIAYDFTNPALLITALTHSSYANEHRNREHNERLEFLGDAVLELCASNWLYRHFSKEPEGKLSRRRANLVCEASLAACARRLGLGEQLYLGKGEDKGGGREKDSLLADGLEALIGAIFLDGGFDQAEGFIRRHLLDAVPEKAVYYDPKTRLQEYLQQEGEVRISYVLNEEKALEKGSVFCSEVMVEGKLLGTGWGHNKKLAEQQAAQEALRKLLSSAKSLGSCEE